MLIIKSMFVIEGDFKEKFEADLDEYATFWFNLKAFWKKLAALFFLKLLKVLIIRYFSFLLFCEYTKTCLISPPQNWPKPANRWLLNYSNTFFSRRSSVVHKFQQIGWLIKAAANFQGRLILEICVYCVFVVFH